MGYMKESDGLTPADQDVSSPVLDRRQLLDQVLRAYRIAQRQAVVTVEGSVAAGGTRPDRLFWGRTGRTCPTAGGTPVSCLDLLADWAPNAVDRHKILVDSADALFFDH